jgi:hypothetical protein
MDFGTKCGKEQYKSEIERVEGKDIQIMTFGPAGEW